MSNTTINVLYKTISLILFLASIAVLNEDKHIHGVLMWITSIIMFFFSTNYED